MQHLPPVIQGQPVRVAVQQLHGLFDGIEALGSELRNAKHKLIVVGEQGVGKSALCNALCGTGVSKHFVHYLLCISKQRNSVKMVPAQSSHFSCTFVSP
jgi:predicted GTPase